MSCLHSYDNSIISTSSARSHVQLRCIYIMFNTDSVTKINSTKTFFGLRVFKLNIPTAWWSTVTSKEIKSFLKTWLTKISHLLINSNDKHICKPLQSICIHKYSFSSLDWIVSRFKKRTHFPFKSELFFSTHLFYLLQTLQLTFPFSLLFFLPFV